MPTRTLAVLGLTEIPVSVADVTVTVAVATFPDSVAVMVAVPAPIPVILPAVAESLLTVAKALFDVVQVTAVVTSNENWVFVSAASP